MTSELPKAERPYRSVKGRTKKAPYVLRMLDERSREGEFPGFGGKVFREIKYVTTPTLSLAWYLPNNFEAEWQGLRVRFRVEQFNEGKLFHWGVSSYSVEPLKANKPLGKVEHLPLDTFLKAAIDLAGVQCITYPPGYEGATVGTDGKPLPGWFGAITKVPKSQKEGDQLPFAWLSETPRDILREFVASAIDSRQRKKLSHEKRLKLVAKTYEKAPERGKRSAVKAALEAVGDHVGDDRVKQLIKEAREAGYLSQSTRSKK